MFTGIVKEIGKVENVSKKGSLLILGISSKIIYQETKISDSVCVNGVCLTVVKSDKNIIFFEVISTTVAKTNLKLIKKGAYVNLEPALKVGDKLGGHFVLGHVDVASKLIRKIKYPDYWQLQIELLGTSRKAIIENGSITIEGISLTVKQVLPKYFTVHIIPFTFENTNLKHKKSGELINIEFDYLLKK